MSTQTNITEFIRGEHHSDYTQLSNKTLRDPSLSWKARGLLAYLLSHSPGYHIRADNLHTFSSDGPYTTSSAIKELKSKGYICFHKRQDPQTKAWIAGNWIISEEAGLLKSLTPEKPDPRFSEVRKSLSQENRWLYKKNQKERKTKKKEKVNERKVFLADNNKFDPEDLPAHIGKYPAVVKAWSEFVKHRKDKHAPLTELACNKLFKRMIHQSPENIISAIDKTIESGWRGLFFQDDSRHPAKASSPTFPQPTIPLDPDALQLNDFLISVLGEGVIQPHVIARLVQQMHGAYDRAGRISIPHYPDKHPNDYFPWSRFFREWIEFLEEKQQSGFVLRSAHDLELTGCRWREYMQYCATCTNHNWETGGHV